MNKQEKKNIGRALTALTMFVATLLTSCSGNNEVNDDGAAGTDVNPRVVFAGGLPRQVGELTLQTNKDGRVASITSDNGPTAVFEYRERYYRGGIRMPGIMMTVTEGSSRYVYALFLNAKGFVRRCMETVYKTTDGKEEKPYSDGWAFSYDKDDRLTYAYYAGAKKEINIDYLDGDIVQITNSTNGVREEPLHVVYHTAATSAPLANKGCLMLFDDITGIDIGRLRYAYYAGILGKAPSHLPVAVTQKDKLRGSFDWRLSDTGYPLMLIYTATDAPQRTLRFAW